MIGSIDTSEFLVAIAASLGFLLSLGSQGIDFRWVLALLAGGLVAAPIAAYLVRIIPPRVLGSAVGGVIVLTNTRTLLRSADVSGTVEGLTLGAIALVWVGAIVWSVRAYGAERAAERATAPAPAKEPTPVP